MPRYRVAVYGSMDGLIFPDLLVTYSSGLKFELRVKQGEYIPVEIFDPMDIKKSLLTGSLKRFIDDGSVVLEFSDLEKKNKRRKAAKKKKKELSTQKLPSVEEEKPNLKEVPKESKKELPQQKSEETPEVDEKDLSFADIKTPEDFSKLSYFRKTKFISQSTNKSLLNELLNKEEYDSHIKNTILFHLQKL